MVTWKSCSMVAICALAPLLPSPASPNASETLPSLIRSPLAE